MTQCYTSMPENLKEYLDRRRAGEIFDCPITFTRPKELRNKHTMDLPTDAKARKDIPLYSGLFKYFPDALVAVAELSRIGNDQHNPGEPLHWAKEKSTDELDALLRHALEAGGTDKDGVRHSTKVAWRGLANLQREIEAAQKSRTPVFDAFRRARVQVLEKGLQPKVVYIHPETHCDLWREIALHQWDNPRATGCKLHGVLIYVNDQIAPGEFYFATGPIDHG